MDPHFTTGEKVTIHTTKNCFERFNDFLKVCISNRQVCINGLQTSRSIYNVFKVLLKRQVSILLLFHLCHSIDLPVIVTSETLDGAHNNFFSTFTCTTRTTFHISLPPFCPFPLSLLLFAFPLPSFLYSNLSVHLSSRYYFHEISISVSSSVSFSSLMISFSSLFTTIRLKPL